MEINIEQARSFLRLLTGSDTANVTFQVFHDPKNEPARPDLANHFVGNLNDNIEYFKQVQALHCGIYVGVNISDGVGRKDENIVGYRCVFADFDGREEPEWDLLPHFVQKRDNTHGHAFWLVSDIETADDFKALQKRIAICCDTDHQVTDPARVVRMAGFNHYKNPLVPAQYSIVEDNTDGEHKYTKAEIEAAFPLNAQQDAELNNWITKRNGIQEGSGYQFSDNYNQQFIKWLTTLAPRAVLGSGSHTILAVAGWAHDRGIPLETAQDIMWEHYNPRCEPPWMEREKHDFYSNIERGYYYSTSTAGCKTAVSTFTSHLNSEPLPPPVDGWEKNKEIGEANLKKPVKEVFTSTAEEVVEKQVTDDPFEGRWSYEKAATELSIMDSKSNHTDLAMAMDGILFHGCNIIRNQGIFYVYSNNRWTEIADDVIKARLHRGLRGLKPNDSFTRGIFNVLCDVVNVEHVQVGSYMNGNKRSTTNLVVFKNGMVDLTNDNPVLEPHDRNFFTFNTLSYDYNPLATSNTFDNYLNSLGWDNDLKIQLAQTMGYFMTNDISLQKFAVFVGKSRGGKGVLTDIIRELVGHANTVAPAMSSIHKDSILHSMSKASLALIPDAHSVAFNSRDTVLSVLKAITGGDPVTFDVKFKPSQTTILTTRFIMSTNNVPEFEDSSGAFANRMLVFPFSESFVGRENVNLRAELLAEIEGIAQFALKGLRSLRAAKGKFTESSIGLQEKQDIKEDMFPLSQFVNVACKTEDGTVTPTSTLYMAYKIWCTVTGVKSPMTEVKFGKTLRNSDLPIRSGRYYVHGEQVRGFKGITLASGYVEKMAVNNVTPIRNQG